MLLVGKLGQRKEENKTESEFLEPLLTVESLVFAPNSNVLFSTDKWG